MKSNVILQLIMKDWRLQSRMITLLTLAGAAALGILLLGASDLIGTVFSLSR